MDLEPQRITVDDRTYQLRPWSHKDGRRWLYRLLAMGTKFAAAAKESSDEAAVSVLVRELGEQTFEELCEVCIGYTDLVHMDGGREAVLPLSEVAAVQMQRRYLDLAHIIRGHLRAEYAPFFSRIGEVLAGMGVGPTRT